MEVLVKLFIILCNRYIFRSGRISSVYIVGCGLLLWVVGHTFSKFVNLECVGMCCGVLEC